MFQQGRTITKLQDLRENVRNAESMYRMSAWRSDPKVLAHKLMQQDEVIRKAEEEKRRLQSEHEESKAELPALLMLVSTRRKELAAWLNRTDVMKLVDLIQKAAQLQAVLDKSKKPEEPAAEVPAVPLTEEEQAIEWEKSKATS